MKKATSKLKKSSKFATKSMTDKLMYIAVLLIAVVLIVQGYAVVQLWNKQETSLLRDEKLSFLNTLDTAYFLGQNNVHYQFVEKRVIIPWQKLQLPINDEFTGISSTVINEGNESTAIPTLDITNEQAYLAGLANLDPGIPDTDSFKIQNILPAQSCLNLVRLYVGDLQQVSPLSVGGTYSKKVFEKTLSDGRQLSAFVAKENLCPYNPVSFIEYLKQIDNY